MSAAHIPNTIETAPPKSRNAKRLRPPMHCYWGTTAACPRNGKVTSLSVEDCFIKTKAEGSDSEIIFVNCWLPTNRWMLLRGRLSYRLPKVGFGIAFLELSETEQAMLRMLLEFFGEDAAPND